MTALILFAGFVATAASVWQVCLIYSHYRKDVKAFGPRYARRVMRQWWSLGLAVLTLHVVGWLVGLAVGGGFQYLVSIIE